MNATTLSAVSALADMILTSTEIAMQIQKASNLVQKAHSEGRNISQEEWDNVMGDVDASRNRLKEAIDKA